MKETPLFLKLPRGAFGSPFFSTLIAVFASGLAAVLFLMVQRVWQGPSGFDVYYYALQTRALALGGLLFSDASLVYRVLGLLDRLVRNPIASSQLLSALSLGAVYGCLLGISFRRGPSLYTCAAASIAVFNPAVFYQLLEFTKNNFSLAFFFCAYAALTDKAGRYRLPSRKRDLLRFASGLLCLAVSVLSHRMMLLVAGLFAAQAAAAALWRLLYGKGKKASLPARLILCCGAVLGAALITGLVLVKTGLLERREALALDAPYQRIRQFSGTRLLPGERIFFILLQTLPVFLVPWLVIKRRLFAQSETVFGLMAFLFVFPFLTFSWDGAGLRLMLLAPLMLAPFLIAHNNPAPAKTPAGLAAAGLTTAGLSAGGLTAGLSAGKAKTGIAALFIAGSVLFTVESAQKLASSKGPDYRQLAGEFASIEELARGRRLVAHRGLAGFLWYEKGIWAENFTPVEEAERYLRVVYAFSPETFEPYRGPKDARPVRISKNYTLIEEYLWQRFYQEKKGLHFLRSELNPYLPRPVSAFAINRKIAFLMSPVSEAGIPSYANAAKQRLP
jgi:hypothetical protein